MYLDKKILELDGWIDQFITKQFPKEDINNVKPHLIEYIKNDKNVVAFSAKKAEGMPEEAEFVLKIFIKKSCDKYCKQVMDYKLFYFNGEDAEQLSKKLIDKVISRFCDGLDSHLDEFLAENYPNLLSSSVIFKIADGLKNDEALKSSLRDDEHVTQHATMFLNSSPYELGALLLLEELIEGLAKLAFFQILENSPEIREILNVATKTNASQCLQRENLPETKTNSEQNPKKENEKENEEQKESGYFFNFLKIFWEALKNLFSKQETSRQPLYNTATSNHFFKPADSESEKASTEVILGKDLG